MYSHTVKEDNLFSFWINLHELDAQYDIDLNGKVNKLTIYLKRELNEVDDAMRRSIRKGGMIQLQKNGIKNLRNVMVVTMLSNQVQIDEPAILNNL